MQNRLTIILLFTAFAAHAQISEGGLPPSFRPEFQDFLAGKMPALSALPALDVANALTEDSQKPGLNRFAAPVAVNVSLDNSGIWHTLPNGDRVWMCALRSPGALGTSMLFDAFWLPPGAQFFAYDGAQRVQGAFTTQSCLPSGKFMVGVLKGSEIYLELYEPSAVQGQSQISANRVDVAYSADAFEGADDFGDALPCNVNINCAAGDNWQTEKNGIARILMVFSNGQGWCSGSLIANTSNTYEPYFLTAYHCQNIGINPNFDLWRFDFDYESPTCANPATEPSRRSVLGCQRVSFRDETDFMLLRLNPIPAHYEVYFNGWNRDGNITQVPAQNAYIHHPFGDIKKISLDNDAATIHPTVLNWPAPFGSSPANSHWKSVTDIGVFQPGSSGSPLLNPNKQIVGQLHGGGTAMGNECLVTGVYFGRFNISWDQGSTPQARLREWLDPNNVGSITQNGYWRPVPQGFTVSGNIKTHWDAPMRGVRVELTGGSAATAYTDSLGNFQFNNLLPGNNYTVTPSLDTNDLNGLTTYDLVLMSKHILTIEPLDSPWKVIAADVNKSNSVTSFDIVEARKVILGIYPDIQSNTSWRFFPAFTTFNNPQNPFMGGLPPESFPINNLQADFPNVNFKGVKVGDLNNSASGN